MSSPAGKFASEGFGGIQVADLEPQELMQFLEFCAGKIHGEQNPRNSETAPARIQ